MEQKIVKIKDLNKKDFELFCEGLHKYCCLRHVIEQMSSEAKMLLIQNIYDIDEKNDSIGRIEAHLQNYI